jgi:cytosine/adenosine deaminase-related metal-dependent hydrolase
VRPTVVQRAATVVTFDADDRVLHDVDLRLADGRIASIGTDVAEVGDDVVDGRDLIVLPGLVNAHQHLSQVGFRAMRGLERAAIGPWLVRIHAGRGTITRGRADGGGAPDEVVQSVDDVVAHSARLIAERHDPRPDAMVRIDLAPCGVHADMPETFRELAALAAEHPGVGLHTHLYEVVDTTFAAEHLGTTPWRVLVDNGWAQERTWLAHMNDAPPHEISEFAASGVGIVHLIAPDLRMGWGCAPLRDYLEAGCRVGFGTTGSASNDGVAGLVLTGLSDRASFVAVGGQVLVRDGRCEFIDERAVADEARRFCRADLVSSKEDG